MVIKMKVKIIAITIVTLMFCCTLSTANILENKKAQSSLGETFLYPPWEETGFGQVDFKPIYGNAWGDLEVDPYEGDLTTYVGALVDGWAWSNGYFTHSTNPNYVAPSDGYYDFTFTYSYKGSLDINVFMVPPFDAFVETDIVLYFTMRIMSSSNVYTKEIVLNEDTYRQDYYTDWDDTKDVSFNDYYVEKGTEVFFSASMHVENLRAVAAGPGHLAEATFDINGKLRKIKINEPNENHKPSIPTIYGRSNGDTGQSYPYEFKSTDPDGDDIKYYIDWRDGNTEWTSYFNSGETCEVSHTWSREGTYTIRAKASDGQTESEWGTLTVTMPKERTTTQNVLGKILNMFPMLNKILSFF